MQKLCFAPFYWSINVNIHFRLGKLLHFYNCKLLSENMKHLFQLFMSAHVLAPAAHLCQAALVPCPLEALVPARGGVCPEVPQPAQVLHLSGGGLPGEQHAGVQRTHRVKHRKHAKRADQLAASSRKHGTLCFRNNSETNSAVLVPRPIT